MPPARAFDGGFNFLGERIPRIGAWIVGVTLATTILARNGIPGLMVYGVLIPNRVLRGEIWRLVTWVFIDLPGDWMGGLGLLFACLLVITLSRDLGRRWGAGRFLGLYLAFAAAAGIAACLVGLVWPTVAQAPYYGPWAVIDALIIAWALLFPSRVVAVSFVVPLSGRNLVYGILLGTLFWSLLFGFAGFVPNFAAEGLMLAYLRDTGLYYLWLKVRLAVVSRMPRRRSHLKPVDRERSDEPPRWLH